MNSKIICGSALDVLLGMQTESADSIVTSPPYWGLRDYGVEGQLGQEENPEEYIEKLVLIFRAARRVLKSSGTFWLNLGDSYCGTGDKGEWIDPKNPKGRNGQKKAINKTVIGYKPKDLMMIPARVAIALQADGWYLRSQIIWHKPNAMPEDVKDRPSNDYELLYLLSKSERYFYDHEILKERAKYAGDDRGSRPDNRRDVPLAKSINGKTGELRNKRAVWSINTKPYAGAHFATMPIRLAEDCIKAGSPEGGIILDPFGGAATTAVAAIQTNRDYRLIELNESYIALAEKRVAHVNRPLFVS